MPGVNDDSSQDALGERAKTMQASSNSRDDAGTGLDSPGITEGKRAEQALAARTEQLDALRTVTAEITRELDLTKLLTLLTRRVAELTHAGNAVVFLWEHPESVLIPRARHGLGVWVDDMRIRLGEGLVGHVAEQRQGLLTNDYRSLPYAHPTVLTQETITAVMAEPLLYHDQLLGVLVADNQETGRPFSLEDQQILRLLAAQAAIAIENARLYEQVADQRDQLRALSMRAMEMREEETRRIARELHDEVGQSLTGMLLGLQGIEGARTHEEIRERTVELRALVSRSMEDLHNLVAALRPTILDDFGLAPALERYLQGIATGSGLRIRTSLAGLQAMRLPPSVEIALFRIVQEAMTNVVKHAQAHNVHVGAEHWGEALVLFIEEDGQGFDVAKARRDRTQSMGLGLLSMEERATLLGGTLVVQSSPGRGTSLVVEIPLPKD